MVMRECGVVEDRILNGYNNTINNKIITNML